MEIYNVNKLENSFEINIPLFHHTIIPFVRQNHRTSIKSLYFNKLQKFRDVNAW